MCIVRVALLSEVRGVLSAGIWLNLHRGLATGILSELEELHCGRATEQIEGLITTVVSMGGMGGLCHHIFEEHLSPPKGWADSRAMRFLAV